MAAFNINIEGGFFSTTDVPITVNHINNPRASTTFEFNGIDESFQFFFNDSKTTGTTDTRLLGGPVNTYLFSDLVAVTEIIDDIPVVIPMADSRALASYLSTKISFFFNPNPVEILNDANNPLVVTEVDVSGRNSLNSGFGDKITASRIPEISAQFIYGIEDGDAIVNTVGSGLFSIDQVRLKINTGTDANGSVEIKSADFIRYIPGYEGWFTYTWAYDTPVVNSRQKNGIWDGDNGFYIGYEGIDFVLGRSRDGVDDETIINPSTIQLINQDGSTSAFNPQNGNVYRITYEYLGYGPVDYEIQNPNKSWTLLSRIEYPNSSKLTHITNSYLPIRAIIENFGNTTDLVGFSGSVSAGSIMNPANQDISARLQSHNAGTSSVGGGITEIITFRNKAIFNGVDNRIKMRVILLSIATDLSKNATIELLKNATFTNVPTWADKDTNNSIMEISTDATINIATGTDLIDFSMAKVDSIFEKVDYLKLDLRPNDCFTVIIDTQNPGGDVTFSTRWTELF
jgi:hypothetical protein